MMVRYNPRKKEEQAPLFLCCYEPAALFKPQVGFFPLNAAGITVSNPAHTLTSSPANIKYLIHRILLPFRKLNLHGPHFPVRLKSNQYRNISFLSLLHLDHPAK